MNIDLELYRKMYLIRACEEAIIKYYSEDEMKTPMHMSMGSEHISSLMAVALGDRAQFFSSYRSHAPYLAVTEDTDNFFLEMYGKEKSIGGGRGGSMHLCNPDKGFILSSAIVASQIPVACGYAWANKMQRNDKVVVVFFGDGATDEGVFYESLNIASLYELPIIFVHEDNELAVHTNSINRKGFDIGRITEAFNGFTFDKEELLSNMFEQIKDDLSQYFPLFYTFEYHRRLEHVGISTDYHEDYRKEPEDWDQIDPVQIQRRKLDSDTIIEAIKIEEEIDEKVRVSIRLAKESK